MNVYVSFEPEGQSGLVANGTYLWDAAKRLGVKLPEKCNSRAECNECAFMIKEGMDSLSPVTDAEREFLGEERLSANERLACQARIVGANDLVITIPEDAVPEAEPLEKFAKEFGKLALDKKYAVLNELEQSAMKQGYSPDLSLIENKDVAALFHKEFEDMDSAKKLSTIVQLEGSASVSTAMSLVNLPWTIGEKVLDLIAVRGRKIHDAEREAQGHTEQKTPEHKEEAESTFTQPE